MMTHSERILGVNDNEYKLVSVLYHTLKEAETLDTYLRSMELEDDADVRQFFLELQEENRRRADRARKLLRQRRR